MPEHAKVETGPPGCLQRGQCDKPSQCLASVVHPAELFETWGLRASTENRAALDAVNRQYPEGPLQDGSRHAGRSRRQIDAPPQGVAAIEPGLLVDIEVRDLERDDLEAVLDTVLRAERARRRVAHVVHDGVAAALG